MLFRKLLFVFSLIVMLFSCAKEYSYEQVLNIPDNTKILGGYGWTFDVADSNYHGCVNTASKSMVNGTTALVVEGVDSAGNDFTLTMGNIGSVTPGQYNIGKGAHMSLLDKDGNVYTFNTAKPASFAIKVVTINDTLFVASFAGTLIKSDGSDTMKVVNGAIKTLIGKTGTCVYSGGTPPTPPVPDPNAHKAVYAFTDDACDKKVISGTLTATVPTTSANTIKYNVNVTDTGVWSVTLDVVDGITYAGSGKFVNKGVQSIVLTASGTPTQAATINLSIKLNDIECITTLTVNDAPPPTSPTCNINTGTLNWGGTNKTFGVALQGTANSMMGIYQYSTANISPLATMMFTFNGAAKPNAGVYKISKDLIPVAGEIGMYYMDDKANDFEAVSGYVFVTLNGSKRVITFCDVTFYDGTNTIKGSGKFSE